MAFGHDGGVDNPPVSLAADSLPIHKGAFVPSARLCVTRGNGNHTRPASPRREGYQSPLRGGTIEPRRESEPGRGGLYGRSCRVLYILPGCFYFEAAPLGRCAARYGAQMRRQIYRTGTTSVHQTSLSVLPKR